MKNIKTAEGLLEYLETFDIPVSLNREQAQTLLDYLDGSGYMLGSDDNGQLYKMDLDEDGAEKTNIDEFIVLVCDWNSEFIMQSRRRIEERSVLPEMKERISRLKRDEKILDAVYEQTTFWKQEIKQPTVRKSSR